MSPNGRKVAVVPTVEFAHLPDLSARDAVRWSVACVEHVLPLFAAKFPDDPTCAEVVALAKTWLSCPCVSCYRQIKALHYECHMAIQNAFFGVQDDNWGAHYVARANQDLADVLRAANKPDADAARRYALLAATEARCAVADPEDAYFDRNAYINEAAWQTERLVEIVAPAFTDNPLVAPVAQTLIADGWDSTLTEAIDLARAATAPIEMVTS